MYGNLPLQHETVRLAVKLRHFHNSRRNKIKRKIKFKNTLIVARVEFRKSLWRQILSVFSFINAIICSNVGMQAYALFSGGYVRERKT
jgi:hypothetical protein